MKGIYDELGRWDIISLLRRFFFVSFWHPIWLSSSKVTVLRVKNHEGKSQ